MNEFCAMIADELNVKRLSFLIGKADRDKLFVCWEGGKVFFSDGVVDFSPSKLAEQVLAKLKIRE